ncbi:MAG: hypothetical protein WDN28_15155 [Chthoniobacter sp.]
MPVISEPMIVGPVELMVMMPSFPPKASVPLLIPSESPLEKRMAPLFTVSVWPLRMLTLLVSIISELIATEVLTVLAAVMRILLRR